MTKTIRNDLISELRQKNDQKKQILIVMLKADGIIVDMPKPNYVSLIITIMETNVGTKITLSSLDARAPMILLSFQSYPNLKILKMFGNITQNNRFILHAKHSVSVANCLD